MDETHDLHQSEGAAVLLPHSVAVVRRLSVVTLQFLRPRCTACKRSG